MNRINNILVIVDPTATEHPAIEKATVLAAKLNARLELFVCDTKAAREARMALHARMQPGRPFLLDVKEALESLARPLRDRGLDVTAETECDDPLHVGLVSRAKRTSADLVLKDTHHHSLARRTFMTNTDWNLIRSCPVPLMLTKAKPWAAHPRVLAAIDPGHANDKPAALDQRILDHAAALCKALDGELHVFHAYVPIAVIAAATGGTPPMALSISPEELAIEEATKRKDLLQLVAPYGVGPAHIHLEVGSPGELIPRAAETLNADVVVMGAVSRSGLKRMFVGATAEDALERLPCDAF
ncbi:MAG TPA: universal stress protein, partial [Steroidobacter sp.]|nr:universal stress protein [Steroidobacter sp.]